MAPPCEGKRGDDKPDKTDKADIREKFFRERGRDNRNYDKAERSDATDGSARARAGDGTTGPTLRARKSFGHAEVKPSLKVPEESKANGDGESSRRQGLDRTHRAPHDHAGRTHAGDKEGGPRRAGPGRARNEPTWFRNGPPDADKTERTREAAQDTTRRVRDPIRDRSWTRNERRDVEPAWMDSTRHGAKPSAHTAEDFQRWKESMKAGSAPKAKAEPVKNEESEQEEEKPPSVEQPLSAPLVMDPSLDKFLNLNDPGPLNGDGEGGLLDGDVMRHAVRIGPPKPSRFMGLFAKEPPRPDPALAPVAESSNPERKVSVEASSEDKQGFQRIMNLLASSNLQGEKIHPPTTVPGQHVQDGQIRPSSAMHQDGPSEVPRLQPVTREPVTSAEPAFRHPYERFGEMSDPMRDGTQQVNDPYDSGYGPPHGMTPQPADYGPFLPGLEMAPPAHGSVRDTHTPDHRQESALNYPDHDPIAAEILRVTQGGHANLMAPYTQGPSPPNVVHPFTQATSPPNLMAPFTQGPSPPNVAHPFTQASSPPNIVPPYTQGPSPPNLMGPFSQGPSPPPVTTAYGAPPVTTAHGGPPGLYGGPIGPGPQPMGPQQQPLMQPQPQRPTDDIQQGGVFPPNRGAFARPPGLDHHLPIGWPNHAQLPAHQQQQQPQTQRGLPPPPGLSGQENNSNPNNNPNNRGGPNQASFFSAGPPGLGYPPGALPPRGMGPPGLNPNLPLPGFYNGPHPSASGGPPGPVPGAGQGPGPLGAVGGVGPAPPPPPPGYGPMSFPPSHQQQHHPHHQQSVPTNMMPPPMPPTNTNNPLHPQYHQQQQLHSMPPPPHHHLYGTNPNTTTTNNLNPLPPSSLAGAMQNLRLPPVTAGGLTQQQLSQFVSTVQHLQSMLPQTQQQQQQQQHQVQHQGPPQSMRYPFGPDGAPIAPPNLGLGGTGVGGGGHQMPPPPSTNPNLQAQAQVQGQLQGGHAPPMPYQGAHTHGLGVGPLGPLGPHGLPGTAGPYGVREPQLPPPSTGLPRRN